MSGTTMVTPEVLWAQRSSKTTPEKNYIFLTISVPDVSSSSIKVDLKSTSLTFTGHSDSKKTTYHVELEFYGEVDVENSKTNHSARDVEFILRKKELKEEYWPRLLKESKKVHFLKTDFDKWVDEDEQEAAPDGEDYGNFGGMGAGGDGGFGGIDFSKLGGGDMGDMGNMGMGGMGGEGDDDDDEDMPELEEDEPAATKGKEAEHETKTETPAASTTSHKIEEVS